jgi:multidrug resistance efflux pump
MSKRTLMVVAMLIAAAALAGCEQEKSATPESVAVPTITQDYGVLAEGQLLPERHIDLAFGIAGRVTELLVQEGEMVTSGQPIARLDNRPRLQAAYAPASTNTEQAAATLQQTELALEQANAGIQRAEYNLGQAEAETQQAEYNLEQAEAETQQAEYSLSQAQLEGPQIALERAQAALETIDAQQQLDALHDAATLTPARIESEIQQALTQLQTAEDALPVVDQPDEQYYEHQVQQAENALEQLQHSTTIVDIGALTDAVDSAEDRVDDEKEFLDKVEKAVEGCQVDVETDTHTKLEFNQKLTYRNETYETGTVYDVQNWIADVLLADYATTVSKATSTCDAERDITIDGHTGSLADAQDDYNDVVTQYDEAVVQLEKAHLQNQKSIRAAQMDLARAQRNLEWAQSGQYSREGILAAAGQSADDPAPPQSVSLAQQQLQGDITLAQAQLDDARKRLSELQDGIDPDAKELAKARLAQAQAHAAYADTQAKQIELRVEQAILALQIAGVQQQSAAVAVEVARLQQQSAAVAVEVARLQQDSAAAAMESARAHERSALAALEAAEADLARNELRAPWSGVVADLPLKVDAYVQPGQPVATLADFSSWKVETDNLTEIEVPEVSLGQKVSITPDALPELDLPGVVTDISALHAEKRGDVTYTVTVAVEKSDPRLRWGMTMVVTFPPAD